MCYLSALSIVDVAARVIVPLMFGRRLLMALSTCLFLPLFFTNRYTGKFYFDFIIKVGT